MACDRGLSVLRREVQFPPREPSQPTHKEQAGTRFCFWAGDISQCCFLPRPRVKTAQAFLSPIRKASASCGFKGSLLAHPWPPTHPHRCLASKMIRKGKRLSMSNEGSVPVRDCRPPPYTAQGIGQKWRRKQESDSRTRCSLPLQENKLVITKTVTRWGKE